MSFTLIFCLLLLNFKLFLQVLYYRGCRYDMSVNFKVMLFYGNRLCEISWLIYVQSFFNCHVICYKLKRNGRKKWGQ